MLGTVRGFNDVQSLNAVDPIDATLSGIVTEVKPEHPLNVSLSIDVTPSGIYTDVKPEHPLNV